MDSTAQQIDDVVSFIKDAQTQLKGGVIIPLENFEKKIRAISETVLELSPANKDVYSEKLDELNEVLREFEIDLRAKQADIKHEIMNLNQRQKALKSYEVTSHSGKPEEEGGN